MFDNKTASLKTCGINSDNNDNIVNSSNIQYFYEIHFIDELIVNKLNMELNKDINLNEVKMHLNHMQKNFLVSTNIVIMQQNGVQLN